MFPLQTKERENLCANETFLCRNLGFGLTASLEF